MRILYLTNGFPYPLTSGYLRHYYLIKELSRHHSITLLSIVASNFAEENIAALAPFTERVLTFVSKSKSGTFKRKALGRLKSVVGGSHADEAVREMRAAVERMTATEPFDAVLFSGKRTFPAIAGMRDLPLVVDMCDATSMKIRGSVRYTRAARLPLLLLDYLQVRQAERMLIKNAAHLLFASNRDREALVGRSKRATVVPNGVDMDFWKRTKPEIGENTLVFTGAMDYPPNTDAALYLIETIMPLVQRAIPDARALIVGRDPPARLIHAGERPNITVTGFVDDVRPYLEQATVFAAPLRFGAGIQNKVLEAMAMEVPVVASPLAADGLRTEDGLQPPVQVARNAQDFADLIIRRLRERAGNSAPDSAARRYLESHFVWRRSGEKLDQVLRSVAPSHAEAASREIYRAEHEL
jgi:sugar transferase (PEP-CTERM/EpsH1 system associated)